MTQLGVSADSGAYLNSGYWASFTLGRFLGIFVSLYFSPQQMVVADLLGCIVAVVVVMLFQSSFTALWLGTVIYGISVGSVYASAINYTERLVGVSGRLLSYLTFFAALGDALVPLSIGVVFDTSIGGRGMMWVVVLVAATATSTFAYLWWWVDRRQRRLAGQQQLRDEVEVEVEVTGMRARETSSGGERRASALDGEDEQPNEDSVSGVEREQQQRDEQAVRVAAGRRGRKGYSEVSLRQHHADNEQST